MGANPYTGTALCLPICLPNYMPEDSVPARYSHIRGTKARAVCTQSFCVTNRLRLSPSPRWKSRYKPHAVPETCHRYSLSLVTILCIYGFRQYTDICLPVGRIAAPNRLRYFARNTNHRQSHTKRTEWHQPI